MLSSLTIDPSGRHLLCGREFFPLIIDTAWSAIADATEDEWRMYLATRRRQGFTAVLVTMLPVLHDRITRAESCEAFGRLPNQHPDYSTPRGEFFERAREYTRIAHEEYGLRLMVTVLWNTYLPGTWGSRVAPGAQMPPAVRRAFVEKVADTLADLEPIFVVGGDDHYDAPAAVAGYLEAIDVLRERAPVCLLTTHTAPRARLPEEIAERLDFFMHQSGHNVENVDLTWQQAERYVRSEQRKPLVNSEPPYELHGKVGGHARWSREEVRAASWVSVLSGSTAGIGYGSHGVWMWATTRGRFEARDASLDPFMWTETLLLPGALDISLLAHLFRGHRLDRVDAAQHLLPRRLDPVLRVGADADGDVVAVYLPYAVEVEIDADLRAHEIHAWDLGQRVPIMIPAHHEAGRTRFEQTFGEADQVIIAERRR